MAICASTQARAEAAALRLGIRKAFGEWTQLLEDPEINAISIATPPALQASIALAALERGKHVFCEKPLATSTHAASALLALSERVGVANMVDFWFPELDEWHQAKSILGSGGIGPLRHVSLSWHVETYVNRMGIRSWKTLERDGGGTLNSFASHVFYNLEWLIGPIKKLWATSFWQRGQEWERDTLCVLCLELEPGVPVSVSLSSNACLGSGHRIEVYGDEGTLVLENPTLDYASFKLRYGSRRAGEVEVVAGDGTLATEGLDGRVAAVSRLVKRFVDWIQTGIPSAPAFKDGYRVQRLLDAALESRRTGAWVVVPGKSSVAEGDASRSEQTSRSEEAN